MTEPTAEQIKSAQEWLINFINEQKFKRGWKFEPTTMRDIEEDALLYGYPIAEFMARYANDLSARGELRELRERERWIPVSEKLPELETEVQVVTESGNEKFLRIALRGAVDEGWCWAEWPNYEYYDLRVTHWRPLPLPPEEKKAGR